jgi:hypothetical protein
LARITLEALGARAHLDTMARRKRFDVWPCTGALNAAAMALA